MNNADWVALANKMFSSFGDTVVDAVYSRTVEGVYDSASGGYTQTDVPTNTKFVFTKTNKRVVPIDGVYEKTDRFGMIRGSDFIGQDLHPGDKVVISSVLYKVAQILPDETNTGAYYEMRLSVV